MSMSCNDSTLGRSFCVATPGQDHRDKHTVGQQVDKTDAEAEGHAWGGRCS